jgi:hypothetical protein
VLLGLVSPPDAIVARIALPEDVVRTIFEDACEDRAVRLLASALQEVGEAADRVGPATDRTFVRALGLRARCG